MPGSEMRTFDWVRKEDQRSRLFRLNALDCFAGGTARANIMRTKETWLDQGREGACTGFGTAQVMNSSPVRWNLGEDDAREIYYGARRLDEWDGEDYEGSSVNGAMKAAREMGYITAWRWAYNLREAQHGVSFHGAGVLGAPWFAGMIETDEHGMVHLTGGEVGGHALAFTGYRTTARGRHYRLENSWGPEWGDRGGCWVSEDGFIHLLAAGELAFPVKKKVK